MACGLTACHHFAIGECMNCFILVLIALYCLCKVSRSFVVILLIGQLHLSGVDVRTDTKRASCVLKRLDYVLKIR